MKVTGRTTLLHDPEVVFDFVADMHNDPEWAPFVHDVRQLHGDGPGPGARYRFLQDLGRHQVEMEATIEEYERPSRIRWSMDHPSMDYEATMTFTKTAVGTKVVQTNVETWHFAPWWMRLGAARLVRRQMKRQHALLARALDKRAEAGSTEQREEE